MAAPLPSSPFTIQELHGKHLHFMGIGGSGITAAAQIALRAGAIISACDQDLSKTTRWMEQLGISVAQGHSADHAAEIDLLVITSAIIKLNPHHPEVMAAQNHGIPVIEWQALLGAYMDGKMGVSIAGVHGKGTVTSMLSTAIIEAGLDPTCEVGAIVPAWGSNIRFGDGNILINEADEFNYQFMYYHPRIAIFNAIEYDHPEFFSGYDDILNAFYGFTRNIDMSDAWPIPPTVVVNAGSPGCLDLAGKLADWPGRIVTFAMEQNADYMGYNLRLEGETSFSVRGPGGREMGSVSLRMPGGYNAQNALAAFAVSDLLGADIEAARRALNNFSGIRRRFQMTQAENDILIIDDYAHHPTAIRLTLEAIRARYPNRRLVAVFQPNLFSRVKKFLDPFSHAFGSADIAVIIDIMPAREVDTGLVHARDLTAATQKDEAFARRNSAAYYGGSLDETRALLETLAQPGDILALLGSGTVYRVSEALLESPAFLGSKSYSATKASDHV